MISLTHCSLYSNKNNTLTMRLLYLIFLSEANKKPVLSNRFFIFVIIYKNKRARPELVEGFERSILQQVQDERELLKPLRIPCMPISFLLICIPNFVQ